MEKVYSPKYIIDLARTMRQKPTRTEEILWNELKSKQLDGFKFRRQHSLNRYIIDFYCHKKKLAIEIDGTVHEDRKEYDEYRDNFFASMEIKTIRFSGDDIINNIDDVLQIIKQSLLE